jgi:hypothetical protein
MNMRERQIEQSAVKIVFGVISFTVNAHGEPNGARNPFRCECPDKEGFLGTQHA